jgi:hypothetical protein
VSWGAYITAGLIVGLLIQCARLLHTITHNQVVMFEWFKSEMERRKHGGP